MTPLFRNQGQHNETEELCSSTVSEENLGEDNNYPDVQNENLLSSSPSALQTRILVHTTPPITTDSHDPSVFLTDSTLAVINADSESQFTHTKADVSRDNNHKSISSVICQPLRTHQFRPGSLFLFNRTSSPGLVKLGCTSRSVALCLRRWSNHCRYTPNLLYSILDVPHFQRVEQLVLCQLREKRRPEVCKGCGGKHPQWFEVSIEQATQLVRDWANFMQNAEPYDLSGQLKPHWREFVKALDVNSEEVNAQVLLQRYEELLVSGAPFVRTQADQSHTSEANETDEYGMKVEKEKKSEDVRPKGGMRDAAAFENVPEEAIMNNIEYATASMNSRQIEEKPTIPNGNPKYQLSTWKIPIARDVSNIISFQELNPCRQKRCIAITQKGTRCSWPCELSDNLAAVDIYERIHATSSGNISLDLLQTYILSNCCRVVKHQDYMRDSGLLSELALRWQDEIEQCADQSNLDHGRQRALDVRWSTSGNVSFPRHPPESPMEPELYTDSGYASINTYRYPVNIVNTHTSFGNTTNKQMFSNWDSQTVYSDVVSMETSRRGGFIQNFAERLFEDVGCSQLDTETVTTLCDGIQHLLADFAIRIGQEGSLAESRKVMAFIHKYRSSVSTAFERISSTLQDEPIVEKPFEDKMSTEEIMGMWFNKDIPSSGSRSQTPEIEELPPEEPGDNLQDLGDYGTLILGTASYQWLVACLRNKLLLTATNNNIRDRIRAEVLRTLPKTETIRSTTSTLLIEVILELDLKLDLPRLESGSISLGTIFTVTGSTHDAQALTCGEYMQQTWPVTGIFIVQLLSDVLTHEVERISTCRRSDGIRISAQRHDSTIEVKIAGTRDIVAEVAEQLCWISAALSQSPMQNGLISSSPSIYRVDPDPRLPIVAQIGKSSPVRFQIDVVHHLLNDVDKPGSCWHDLFRQCVIVEGFPIRQRLQTSLGLELSLAVAAELMDTKHLHEFAGHTFLKGFSTMLVPIRKMSNILVWHLCRSKNNDRISYLDHGQSELCTIDTDIGTLRHIIGWCGSIQNYCGTAGSNFDIKSSAFVTTASNGVLKDCFVSMGGCLTSSAPIILTSNHDPMLRAKVNYIHKLRYLESRFVLLWDTRDHRGWLVNGLPALLHLVRQSLKFDKEEGGELFVLNENDLEEYENSHGPRAARDFLTNPRNLCKKITAFSFGSSQEYETLADRILHFYEVIENMLDKQNFHVNWADIPRSKLEGWDFLALARKERMIKSSMFTLPSLGKGWVDLVRTIGAVTFFGGGFGEILKPKAQKCSSLPCNKFFIAVTLTDIQKIMMMNGCDPEQRKTPKLLTRSPEIIWHSPPGSLEQCGCITEDRSGPKKSVTQVLWLQDFANLLPESGETLGFEKYASAAIIFGHSDTIEYYMPDLGLPVFGVVPDRAQELEIFEDSGIGSSLSGTVEAAPFVSKALSSADSGIVPMATSTSREQWYGSVSRSGADSSKMDHEPQKPTLLGSESLERSNSLQSTISGRLATLTLNSPESMMFKFCSMPIESCKSREKVDEWFRLYDKLIGSRLFEKRSCVKLSKSSRTRIAILDSCVDRNQALMPTERLKEVKPHCVCPPDKAKSCRSNHICEALRVEGQWEHGTHVTALLSELAPFADIYVAEIGPANEKFTDESLVQALNFSSEKQADIVVMAFGWEWNPKQPIYPDFQRIFESVALPTARRLLFAAASNGGANEPRTYPARHPSVFAIHASNHEGKRKGYNPTPVKNEKNYITIGHEVRGYNKLTRESGTSFATPVAAALAAAVIEMIKLHGNNHAQWVIEYLHTYDGMNKVLGKMSKPRDGYDYLDWVDLFSMQRTNEEVCDLIVEWLKR